MDPNHLRVHEVQQGLADVATTAKLRIDHKTDAIQPVKVFRLFDHVLQEFTQGAQKDDVVRSGQEILGFDATLDTSVQRTSQSDIYVRWKSLMY